MSTILTIGGIVYQEGTTVRSPHGIGTVIGLDPFSDREIGVLFEDSRLIWFSFREINQEHMLTCEYCGRPTGFLANGIGACCWGRDD